MNLNPKEDEPMADENVKKSTLDSIREKIAGNPILSMLASAGASYVAVKYGPAISTVCSIVGK